MVTPWFGTGSDGPMDLDRSLSDAGDPVRLWVTGRPIGGDMLEWSPPARRHSFGGGGQDGASGGLPTSPRRVGVAFEMPASVGHDPSCASHCGLGRLGDVAGDLQHLILRFTSPGSQPDPDRVRCAHRRSRLARPRWAGKPIRRLEPGHRRTRYPCVGEPQRPPGSSSVHSQR